MNSLNTSQSPAASDAMDIAFVAPETFTKELQEFSALISARAYERYERRGREDGHALEDWCCAEEEVGRLAPFGIFEGPEQIEVNVRLLGCRKQEIEACLEPRRLLVRACREVADNQTSRVGDNPNKSFNGIFLALNLPAEVDTANASARFENGDLCLTLPKLYVQ